MSETDELTLKAVHERGEATVFDVAVDVGVHSTTARRSLQRLVDAELLRASWRQNITVYRPAREDDEPQSSSRPTAQGNTEAAAERDELVLAALPATARAVTARTGVPGHLVSVSLSRLRRAGRATKGPPADGSIDRRAPTWSPVPRPRNGSRVGLPRKPGRGHENGISTALDGPESTPETGQTP